MVCFKENTIFLRFQRCSNIFQGRGPTFSRECGDQMPISIETYRIYDFPGGTDPISFLWIHACV